MVLHRVRTWSQNTELHRVSLQCYTVIPIAPESFRDGTPCTAIVKQRILELKPSNQAGNSPLPISLQAFAFQQKNKR